MTDRIRLYEPVSALCQNFEQFEFRKDRPARWLQRLLLWGLAKLGCHVESNSVTYVEFRPNDVVEALSKQRNIAYELGRGDPMDVIMGCEDLFEILRVMPPMQAFHFDATRKVRDHHGGTYVMGMRVTVVPYMRGVVVYPRFGA